MAHPDTSLVHISMCDLACGFVRLPTLLFSWPNSLDYLFYSFVWFVLFQATVNTQWMEQSITI